jgi:hypothetical protein
MSGHVPVTVGSIVGLTPPFPPPSVDDWAPLEAPLEPPELPLDDVDDPSEVSPLLEPPPVGPPSPELDVAPSDDSLPPAPEEAAASPDDAPAALTFPPTSEPTVPPALLVLPAAHDAPKHAAMSARNEVDEATRGFRTVHPPR